MTEQYKERLIEIAKEVRELANVYDFYQSTKNNNTSIRFLAKLWQLLGYISALEENK